MRKKQKLPWLYPLAFAVLALLWAGFLFFRVPDWFSVMAGFGTGAMFMAFASEVTDDKPLGSPPSDRRDRSAD